MQLDPRKLDPQVRIIVSCAILFPFILALLFVIGGGCATSPKSAQGWVNEANVLIQITAQQLEENLKSGSMTKFSVMRARDELKEQAARVDQVQKLLDAGRLDLADPQAEGTYKMVKSLHDGVQERSAK